MATLAVMIYMDVNNKKEITNEEEVQIRNNFLQSLNDKEKAQKTD